MSKLTYDGVPVDTIQGIAKMLDLSNSALYRASNEEASFPKPLFVIGRVMKLYSVADVVAWREFRKVTAAQLRALANVSHLTAEDFATFLNMSKATTALKKSTASKK
jgi:predicted DNA-binding transcriptional regulator AlpA